MFPNFICIGAQRCGTTWLYVNLKKHPEIWLPPVKEVHYFDEKEAYNLLPLHQKIIYNYQRQQKRWKRVFNAEIKRQSKNKNYDNKLPNLLWEIKYLTLPRNDYWYAQLFESGNGKKVGEITPEYSRLSHESVAHIHKLMPNTKIIFLMRDPTQRAISHALKYFRDRKIPISSVSESEFINHFESEKSRMNGNYLRTLNTWSNFYPENQIFTAFFEEINQNPQDLLLRLFQFLEVSVSADYISPKVSRKINASPTASLISEHLLKHLAGIYYQEIEQLDKMIGGYSSNWLAKAQIILQPKIEQTAM